MKRYMAALLLIFITAIPHQTEAFDDKYLAYVEYTQQPSPEFKEKKNYFMKSTEEAMINCAP